jgi:3-oxoacyl-[acyl-carrier protein] reductase
LTQALGPHIRPDGRVLFFSTSLTSNPIAISPGYLPYVMCKGAVEQMARVLSRDPAFAAPDRRITVNVVSPGPIETELFLAGKSQELLDRIASMHPSQRIGQPDEVRPASATLTKHLLMSAHHSGRQCSRIPGFAHSELGARTEPAGQRRDGCLRLRSSTV